jgi:hypothetical protein
MSRPAPDQDSQPWRPMPRALDTVELVERVGRLDAGTRGTVRVEGTYIALVDVGDREALPNAPEALVPIPYRAMRRIQAAGEAA